MGQYRRDDSVSSRLNFSDRVPWFDYMPWVEVPGLGWPSSLLVWSPKSLVYCNVDVRLFVRSTLEEKIVARGEVPTLS